MALTHTVVQGDCLASIAAKYGFADYKVIWNDGRNSALRAKRKNPNVLFPGDVVSIPDIREKKEARSTGHVHKFQVKTGPVHLHLILKNTEGEPYANQKYTLKTGEKTYEGVTTAKGEIIKDISAAAGKGELTLWSKNDSQTGAGRGGASGKESAGAEDEEAECVWTLYIGYLNPVEETSGVQARLMNLGFYAGEINGTAGPETRSALKLFQEMSLKREDADGEMDSQTRSALLERHGC